MLSRLASVALLALLLAAIPAAARAGAAGLADDGGAEWRVEQPSPPPPGPAVESSSSTPISLGRIGDIEFWAPNRGALITAGNGTTILPGVWFYNGENWRQLATVCGGADGRIAWAGADEFWTISDGRPGQAVASASEQPPLEDNTLCHFAPPPGEPNGHLEVVASYAAPAFLSTSYQPMHAAACLSPSDCWFAGGPLPEPQIGSFHLHWNGHSLEAEPYLPEGHTIEDMREFEGKLYESTRLLRECSAEAELNCDRDLTVLRHPPPLHLINGEGAQHVFEPIQEVPLYGQGEFPTALNYLHLSADSSSLWAAAGPELELPEHSEPAGVTVVRLPAGGSAGWGQVLGPETKPTGLEAFPEAVVDAIAAEPNTEDAWIALDSEVDAGRAEPNPSAAARVAHIAADGKVSDELELPAGGEPYGPKGAASKLVCPAAHDCWLATTDGWLLHLSTAAERAHPEPDGDPVFSAEEPITIRPPDQGLPSLPPDAPPVDDSGLEETAPGQTAVNTQPPTEQFAKVTLPLLSGVRSRLLHRTTLQLSFHLAVRARVRLLAKRRRRVVASTPTRTLPAGAHRLLLHLDIRLWPTKLELKTHALAPLPTRSTREAGTDTASTSLVFLNALELPGLELAR